MAVKIEETIDLDMDDSTDDVIPQDVGKLAETKKELGNQQYKLKQYSKALALYTEAIELCPENSSYFGNRSACYMMQGNYKKALEDAKKSVELDSNFVKGWIRLAKCQLALGDITSTEQAINTAKSLEPENSALVSETWSLECLKTFSNEATKAYAKTDYRKVLYFVEQALNIGVACTRLKVLRAECLARLGRYVESQELASDILSIDNRNADALLVRGMCLYYQDHIEKAFQHFQQVLKFAPDHSGALDIYKRAKLLKKKREEGNEAFKSGNWAEAFSIYTAALEIDPGNTTVNAKLYFNRATAASKLGKTQEVVDDCTLALELDPNYIKALLRRAKTYMELLQYEDAVKDYEKATKMDRSPDIKHLLQEAKLELKKSQRKDYYKILGVEKTATTDDIKKAYRKRALLHHPDRHANASEGEQKDQEKKFKVLGEAYSILSDPKKRARYDNGQDIEDLTGGMDNIDPHQMFQAFFSSAGGTDFFQTNLGGASTGGYTFHFG